MDKWLYLIINLGAVSIPLVASFDKRMRFDKQWKFLFPAMALTMLFFIPWDMLKTDLRVWGFNPRYLSGVYLGNLPIEEWLFFITIPYACLFTYHALNYLIIQDYLGKFARPMALLFGVILLVAGTLNLFKLYTFITFIVTGTFLLLQALILKKEYLGRFFLMYFVTLIPFFIVNGLLTGSWIPEEVVYYDNSHNLGIRIGTIPLEDMVYGMLLLLMNVSWFEFFRTRERNKLPA